MLPGLLALFVASFAYGTTEFIIAGLVPSVAADLSVSISDAGLLVSIYAIGVVLGAPLLSLPAARLERKRALLMLLGLFAVAKVLCAIAPNYPMLMAARLLASFTQANFFGVASIVVATRAKPGHEGRAIAFLWSGVGVSNIFGVPLGTAIGQAWGWRASFVALAATALIAMVAIAAFLPRIEATMKGSSPSLRAQLVVFRRPTVVLSCLIVIFWMVGFWSMFTYIAPILLAAGALPQEIPTALLIFGIGSTIGSLLSGRLADWNMSLTLTAGIALAGICQFLISSFATSPAMIMALLGAQGVFGFSATSSISSRIIKSASDAPELASTSVPALFNLGIALGSWIGAMLLNVGFSPSQLPFAGSAGYFAAAFIGLAMLLRERALERHAT